MDVHFGVEVSRRFGPPAQAQIRPASALHAPDKFDR
jgi:hypothetical protein